MSKLGGTREPAVAGLFYPSNPRELEATVKLLIEEAKKKRAREIASLRTEKRYPSALIAPHAGYVYSGQIAASAYVYLEPGAGSIDSVAVIGPSHRFPIKGLALSSAAIFAMPGFELEADEGAVRELYERKLADFSDAAHAAEHSVEVHFPFIKVVLGQVRVVAVAVGEASPEEVGSAIELLLSDPRRVVVVSSDLSHYLDYDTAVRVDTATARAIVDLQFEAIGYDNACGRNAVRGLLWIARKNGMKAVLADLRNSGDTAGPKDSVVGYPAVTFWPG